jgi:hypothetical protein
MIFKDPILTILEKIEKTKRVRTELIRQAVDKYPEVGFSYYRSAENRMIQSLTSNIADWKYQISELTNKN